MGEFIRDPSDWLGKLSPAGWVCPALAELPKAETAYAARNTRAGAAGMKRAAGMALNGALLVEPNAAWGRPYVEHVEALAKDDKAPEVVRAACRTVLEALGPSYDILQIGTPRGHLAALEATKDVIAHAWA